MSNTTKQTAKKYQQYHMHKGYDIADIKQKNNSKKN